MGIDAHAIHLLRRARAERGALGQTITLGRQALHLRGADMKRWTGIEAAAGSFYCEAMLREHFGACTVHSIDNSAYEGATFVFDMNQPLPDALLGQYDSVLDFGCTEHIYDVASALRNTTALCKLGGMIMHVVPTNGFCGHGFYQFSPELFFSIYAESKGFEGTEVYVADVVDKRHWYRVSPPANGRRVNIRTSSETYVIAMTRRVSSHIVEDVQQSDYVHAWAGGEMPALTPQPVSFRTRVRDRLCEVPFIARCLRNFDAMLSPDAPRRLNRNPHLERISTSSLG